MLKVLRFETSDEGWFFVFGVLNAKSSAFRTPNACALKELYIRNAKTFYYFFILIFSLLSHP